MIDGAGGHLPDAARQGALSTEDPLLTTSQNEPPIHEVGVPRPSVSEGRPIRRLAPDTDSGERTSQPAFRARDLYFERQRGRDIKVPKGGLSPLAPTKQMFYCQVQALWQRLLLNGMARRFASAPMTRGHLPILACVPLKGI